MLQLRQLAGGLLDKTLDDILVGQSRLNTAKKGQPAALSRVWGKHISLQFRDRNANTRSGITFGYTAQWGGRIAGSMADSKIGLRGGQRVRVGESVKEKIVAGQAGYFIENAIALCCSAPATQDATGSGMPQPVARKDNHRSSTFGSTAPGVPGSWLSRRIGLPRAKATGEPDGLGPGVRPVYRSG